MRGRCILVFGVSGVGKTSTCGRFVDRHPEWLHLRASELLSQVTRKDPQLLRVEPESAIRANQALLATALHQQRRLRPESHFLIDAHAVIDNDNVLVRVPLDAVRGLQPDGIILLEAPTELIAKRRNEDVRKRPRRSIAEIAQEREVEHETVSDYAHHLRIPMATGNVVDGFELDPLIAAVESARQGSG